MQLCVNGDSNIVATALPQVVRAYLKQRVTNSINCFKLAKINAFRHCKFVYSVVILCQIHSYASLEFSSLQSMGNRNLVRNTGFRRKKTQIALSDMVRDWRVLLVGSDPALRNRTLQLGCAWSVGLSDLSDLVTYRIMSSCMGTTCYHKSFIILPK